MPALPRLWHDIDHPDHPLFCGQPGCPEQRPRFLLGRMEVGLELMTSDDMVIAYSDGTKQPFREGSVRCARCGTEYFPQCVWDPAG
jgi:hypothetical protein